MNHIVFTRQAEVVLQEKLTGTPPESIFILADENTTAHCRQLFGNGLAREEHLIVIEAGEAHKSLESVARIWSVLTAKGAKRNSVLVNVGGGLVTDIGGFAASCFKRGIRCMNVPTTLLSQVDASVGGKTGINFGGFKNEIGTFSIPEWVIIDNRFLATLPERQLLSGFAEMLKHGLLAGEEHLTEILVADPAKAAETAFLPLIQKSVAVKEQVVEADPTERGVRKALNLGHTAGHAIESVAIARNAELYHGDAVAYGLIAELYLSVKKTGFDAQWYEQIRHFIRRAYPAYHPLATPDELYELMLHDKKNDRAGVNFTLLEKPGTFIIDNYCEKNEIIEALEQL